MKEQRSRSNIWNELKHNKKENNQISCTPDRKTHYDLGSGPGSRLSPAPPSQAWNPNEQLDPTANVQEVEEQEEGVKQQEGYILKNPDAGRSYTTNKLVVSTKSK